MLAGALLQHALSIGLHVKGVGQDFSRTKVQEDRAQVDYRTRLWYICITVCKRVSTSNGLPPPMVPDTYYSEIDNGDRGLVPASVAFEKTVTTIASEALMTLERHGLSTLRRDRVHILQPIMETLSEQMQSLILQCPEDIGMCCICLDSLSTTEKIASYQTER